MPDETTDELERLRAEVARLEAEAGRLRDALRWCGGAPSFAPEGEAHEGWLRVVAPLLGAPADADAGGDHAGRSHCDRWVRAALAEQGVPADRLTADDVEALLGHVGRLVAALVRLRRDQAGPWDADLAEVRAAESAIRALAGWLAKGEG